MTEAKVREICKSVLNEYFQELAKKPVSEWAEETVETIMSYGIMEGDEGGNPDAFRPRSYITREETAQVQLNTLESEALAEKISEVVKEILAEG